MRVIGLVILAAILTLAPLAPQAQTAKLSRIGSLGNTTAALEANLVRPFRDGLRELGYVEGQNILIEYRWAEGKYERFPALIAELISQKVDVIGPPGHPPPSPSRRRQHRFPSSWLLSAIPSVQASSRPSATPVGTSPA
jgi:putative ABC transport system substrate-binding protein